MYDMMVVQSNGGLTPLTPVSAPMNGHHHPEDLSPRSARSTSSSLNSGSPASSSPIPIKDFLHHQLLQEGVGGSDDFSAFQRLQYALERDPLFMNHYQSGPNGNKNLARDLHLGQRQDHDHDRESPKRMMIDKLNASLEDTGPRSTDSSSNLIDSPTGSPNADPANIFQCPLCAINCNGRHSFNEHLVTHTQQHICPKCDYTANRKEDLMEHLQDCHDLTDPLTELADEEVRVPKMNSQGKVKTHKCKQCQHVSITKMDFWAHSKSHIRAEKMLTCPKCEFVTEFKHHLEYHLRNHVGSKPFQCKECPYSCVNKSMLNSHIKSHSNIYQYKCADCTYATKYCHSLKLHLRKYKHNPSVVLNPDGTQNPFTIDVYGTRRGPKVKRTQPGSEVPKQIISQGSPNSIGRNSGEDDDGKSRDSDPNSQPSPKIKREKNNFSPDMKRFPSDASDSMSDTEVRHQLGTMNVSDINRINFSSFQPPIHIGDPNKFLEQMATKNSLEFYAAALNNYIFTNPMLRMQPDLANIVAKEQQDQLLSVYAAVAQQHSIKPEYNVPPLHSPHEHEQQSLASQTPLDLRQPQQSAAKNYKLDAAAERHHAHRAEDAKKRKRKGKAQRYERQIDELRELQQQNDGKALDFSNNGIHLRVEKQEPLNLICKYCQISFVDKLLYSMHMRYHSGDKDPFSCKVCGKKTQDKIAFSIHLTTDPH